MGTTDARFDTLLHLVAWAAASTLIAQAAHAGPNPPPARATPCDVSLSDRLAPGCGDDAEGLRAGEPSAADSDGPAAASRDELADRAKQIETMNQQIRMERRRKDTLLHLYPDEAAHTAARLHDLAEADRPIRAAEIRVEDLAREHRRLAEATALYAGKPVPTDLRHQMQRVDVASQQAAATLRNCREQRAQVARTYDDELVVLRKLWLAQQDLAVSQRGQGSGWKRETVSAR